MQNIRFIPPLILNLLCMTCQLGSDAEKKNRSICASQGSALHPAGRSRLINNFGNILALYLLLGNCPQLRRRQNPCLPVLRKNHKHFIFRPNTIYVYNIQRKGRYLSSSGTRSGNSPVVHLRYMPLYTLVKLTRTRATPSEGLQNNVIPIEPVITTYRIKIKDIPYKKLCDADSFP